MPSLNRGISQVAYQRQTSQQLLSTSSLSPQTAKTNDPISNWYFVNNQVTGFVQMYSQLGFDQLVTEPTHAKSHIEISFCLELESLSGP